jgi:hypothetical protein
VIGAAVWPASVPATAAGRSAGPAPPAEAMTDVVGNLATAVRVAGAAGLVTL